MFRIQYILFKSNGKRKGIVTMLTFGQSPEGRYIYIYRQFTSMVLPLENNVFEILGSQALAKTQHDMPRPYLSTVLEFKNRLELKSSNFQHIILSKVIKP